MCQAVHTSITTEFFCPDGDFVHFVQLHKWSDLIDDLDNERTAIGRDRRFRQVSQPSLRYPGYTPDADGMSRVLPGMAGIAYNARVGDPAFGWAADHVEPGVSIANADQEADFALHYLTCIGNRAIVMGGLAKGAEGIVTGEHARLLIDFPPDVNELLCVGDPIQLIACGRGLAFADYPQIDLKKCSPRLINSLPIEASRQPPHPRARDDCNYRRVSWDRALN